MCEGAMSATIKKTQGKEICKKPLVEVALFHLRPCMHGNQCAKAALAYITPITNRPKVTVTLQPKGSVVSPSTITVAFEQKYGTLPEPEARDGYRFTGWYLGGTQITANSNVQNSSNHILTGKWKYIGSASPQSIVPDELINKIGNSIIEGE